MRHQKRQSEKNKEGGIDIRPVRLFEIENDTPDNNREIYNYSGISHE